MDLPKDSIILLSTINMKLRDRYSHLDELCDDLQVNREDLEKQLAAAGFEYDAENNRFW